MKKFLLIAGFFLFFYGCGKEEGNRKTEILKEGFKILAPGEKENLKFTFLKDDSVVVDIDAADFIYCKGFLTTGNDTLLLYSDTISNSPFEYHNIVGIPANGVGTFLIQNISPDTQRIYRYYVRIRWE